MLERAKGLQFIPQNTWFLNYSVFVLLEVCTYGCQFTHRFFRKFKIIIKRYKFYFLNYAENLFYAKILLNLKLIDSQLHVKTLVKN